MLEQFEELGEIAAEEQLSFRVLLASRRYPSITMAKCQEINLDIQDGHEMDITSCVRSKLRLRDPKLKSELSAQISEKAVGIFLRVVLVVRILNKDSDRGNAHRIRRRLEEIPPGLHELFEDIIRRGTADNTYLVPVLS